MNSNPPSATEWRSLYAAADEFRAAAPWTRMDEVDLFGVTDPETGETGYCSILGGAGEHFALLVYEGSKGLESFLRLQAMGEAAIGSMEASLSQICLTVSFEDREFLEREDRAVIKSLGLKYRGKNAWPMFRRMRPFRMPDFIDGHQARFLTLALQQALDVTDRYQEDPDLLGSPDNPTFLVRTRRSAGDGVEWFDERQESPEFEEPEPVPAYEPNDIEAERIRRLPVRPISIEADFILMPAPVEDEDGAYFPYMLLAVEPTSRMMVTVQTASPWDYSRSFAEAFLKAIDTLGTRPREILVGRSELLEVLSEVGTRCDIPIVQSEDLEALDEVLQSLMSQIG